jgi:hypothetical protein
MGHGAWGFEKIKQLDTMPHALCPMPIADSGR